MRTAAATLLLATVPLLPLTTRLTADEPRLEQAVLFTAGENGHELYRIPGVVVTPNGVVLAYCEARTTARSDWGDIDIVLRRSDDGGNSWGPMQVLVNPEPGSFEPNPLAVQQNLSGADQITANNPVAIVGADPDTIHFLYCIEYARCFYIRSDDAGRTFSEPREITSTFESFRPHYDWKVLATGPGHGIRLSTGRLIVPVWLSTGTGGHAHRPSVNSVIWSDDDGQTWQAGDIVSGPDHPVNPSETVAVELSNGSVMLNFRSESRDRLRAVAISPNGATHWSDIAFDPALPEPVCMGSIVRGPVLPKDSKPSILFANPHNAESRTRQNVTIKLSRDDGKTWPISRTLEPGPSGYSDLAVGPDDTIYCFYERGPGTRTLTMARFNLAWLMQQP